jgi:hypothetical protein
MCLRSSLLGIFVLVVSGTLAITTSVSAFRMEDRMMPEPVPSPVSAFRSVFPVPTFGTIVVPTIVSVPVENLRFESTTFAVYEVETGEYVKPAYFTNQTAIKTPVVIENVQTGEYYPGLVDADIRTLEQFDVAVGGSANNVTLVFTHAEPILSSQLEFTLDRNVNLPETVAIQAVVNGREQVVRTEAPVTGSKVSFPPTTASVWYVTMTYRQPLRLSKLSLQNETAGVSVTKEVRFLAQPNRTYEVYFDADTTVAPFGRESGNLTTGSMVTVQPVTNQWVTSNPTYQMVDRDADEVVDQRDNCPGVLNPDQADIDRNGMGDACEDFDRDGVSNTVDNCINLPNQNQRDEDGDGMGDVCDDAESRLTEKYQFIPWVALGVAVVTILSMFAIVARRPATIEETTEPTVE